MQITIHQIRELSVTEGHFLCNMKQKAISSSNKIFLAKEADPTDFVEISAEEKEALEKQWEDEALAEAENI